ncbi:MAG: glycosyltransferase [Chloroflexota bacterium]|nr:glycosyltransferase [Chloroflexota bacterium]
MRVTHLYKHYLPHPGGVQSVMHALARGTAARGHDVRAIVCADGPRPTRRALEGVDVLGVPSFGELQSVPLAPTYLALPARSGEILHVHESFPPATLAALIRLTRRPAASAVVSWHFDVVRQRALAPLHRALAARLLARAAAIHVATDLHALSPVLRAFASKVRVIPYIVDVDRFRRDASHPMARRIRSWAGEAPVALTVGRLIYYKGVDVLLDALAAAPRVRGAIVGDGPLRDELRARAVRLGIADRVLWLGEVTDDDLRGAYGGADLFVLPSTAATEAFGVAQVEAMAAGLPVVSTRLGTGVERVNVDGETGRLVAPRDASALAAAIEELVGDDALRGRLASGALERSRDFAADRLLDRYLALYEGARP